MTFPMSSWATRSVRRTPRSSAVSVTSTESGSSTISRARYSRRSLRPSEGASATGSARLRGRLRPLLGGALALGPGELLPDARLGHEPLDRVRRLCSDAEPMQSPFLVDLDDRGIVERVIPADVLDEPAVTRTSLVRDDDAVEGPLGLAHPPQPDPYRHAFSLSQAGEVRHARDPGHPLAAQHRLHHLARLLELLEQGVHLSGRGPRPSSDPEAPGPADHSGIASLLPGHGPDDRLRARHVAVVDLELLQRVLAARNAGEHRQQILERPELAHLFHLLEKVLERERCVHHLLGRLGRTIGVEVLLRLVDQREHVAHAHDARGHPVRMERLEVRRTFPRSGEEHRSPGYGCDRQRGAAPSVAIELRQDEPGRVDLAHEGPRLHHGVLSGHRVAGHQDVVGPDGVLHASRLAHHVLVDVEATGRVNDDDVEALTLRVLQPRLRDLDGVLAFGDDRYVDLLAERHELVDGSRAPQVGGDEERTLTLLL